MFIRVAPNHLKKTDPLTELKISVSATSTLVDITLVSVRWVEEDPKEIIQSVYECIERTCEKLRQLNVNVANIKGAKHVRCVNGDFRDL